MRSTDRPERKLRQRSSTSDRRARCDEAGAEPNSRSSSAPNVSRSQPRAAMSPSAFSHRTAVRKASSVSATSRGPCVAETRPPGPPMMSTPFASMARRRRLMRLGSRAPLMPLKPSRSGSKVAGSIAMRPRVREDHEGGRLAVDAPGHLLLDEDLAHPLADRLGRRLGLGADVARARRAASVATAAAAHSGLALKVPWWPIFSRPAAFAAAGSSWSMSPALPATAPPGSPPATILASTQRSGVTPKRACAPPRDQRKPVITSSMISTTPRALRHFAQAGEEARRAAAPCPTTRPTLEDHRRDVVARSRASRRPARRRRPAAGSVCSTSAGGMPGRHRAVEVRHRAGARPDRASRGSVRRSARPSACRCRRARAAARDARPRFPTR